MVAIFRLLPWPLRRLAVRLLTPNYTLGVMVFVVSRDRNILLVKQSYRNGWCVTGGLMKRNEQPPDAAARELREETGLSADIRPVHRSKVANATQVVTFFMVAVVDDVDAKGLKPKEASEITGISWFDLDDLPEMDAEVGEITEDDLVAIDAAIAAG